MDTDNMNPLHIVRSAQNYNLEFRGSGGEYFRIWIINTLLTIVTLGFYSPWAKVRKMKYFYRNTFLAGDSFDYHADPVKILIGRLIIAGLFISMQLSSLISPILWVVMSLVFLLAIPWLLTRSAIFKYRNSSYRNIRFGFNKNYTQAYTAYTLGFLVSVFTFYICMPYALYRHYKFMLNNVRYGKQTFQNSSRPLSFFKIIYASILYAFMIFMLPIFAIAVVLYFIGVPSDQIPVIGTFLGVPLVYLTFAFTYGYQRALTINEISNHTELTPIKFKADLHYFNYGFIHMTNLLLVVFTLGFATPWAQVRSLRYRLENSYVQASEEDFNQFLAAQENPEGYMADAATDIWDLDFGL